MWKWELSLSLSLSLFLSLDQMFPQQAGQGFVHTTLGSSLDMFCILKGVRGGQQTATTDQHWLQVSHEKQDEHNPSSRGQDDGYCGQNGRLP